MLFIIDMQNDFVDQKKGKMLVEGAHKLVPHIKEKIKAYEKNGDKIFYTLDIHEKMKDDKRKKEDRKWGQSIYHELKDDLSKHTKIEKKYYGIDPEKASYIKKTYKDMDNYVKEIELVGVETHICVLSNAIILQNMFPESKIIIDSSLTTSNDSSLHDNALEVMRGLKMEVR